MNDFTLVFTELDWFFQLGYVVVISTVLSMILVNVLKYTIFKNFLSTADAASKDKVLGAAGTITSLVMYGIVYIANEMILQGTFLIVIDWHVAWATITAGAAVVWVAAKGLYTVLHKFMQRLKDKKLTDAEKKATKAELDEVKKAVKKEQETKILSSSITNKTRKIL